jgi:hypothetical protein
VLLVAGIAAVVSYIHIERLARAYGQEPVAAYLLPLSIDGVVATSSLVMLRAARAGASAPWLARVGLAFSVAATLAANVASGLPYGWRGAVLAGWPAIGFVVSAETAISMSRLNARHQARPGEAPRVAPATPQPRATKRVPTRQPTADLEVAALDVLARHPDISGAALGRALGASPRTGQRLLAQLDGVAPLVGRTTKTPADLLG